MAFATNTILRLHGMLYRYHPADGGRWKSTNNEIVDRDTKGQTLRVRFSPATAVATPQAMDDLDPGTREAQQAGNDPRLVLPLAILDVLCIHPFSDGNAI